MVYILEIILRFENYKITITSRQACPLKGCPLKACSFKVCPIQEVDAVAVEAVVVIVTS